MRADAHNDFDQQPLRPMRFAERLRCGIADCGRETTTGLIEPDPETDGLWRLLPLCPVCQRELASATRPSRPRGMRAVLWRDERDQSMRYS